MFAQKKNLVYIFFIKSIFGRSLINRDFGCAVLVNSGVWKDIFLLSILPSVGVCMCVCVYVCVCCSVDTQTCMLFHGGKEP